MTNEIQKSENIGSMLSANVGSTYCSVRADGDRKTAAKVFNALNNPEYQVSDFINKEINVENILVEIIQLEDEETGEMKNLPRVVLIDQDGKAYQSVSIGMFNVINYAQEIFGNAPWDPPLTFVIKNRQVAKGSMLTADIIG